MTITTSDPTNVPITSTNSRSWYNYYLPPNGTEYDLGEFAFSVSHNAPDGSYIMRIEIDYESQGTALQKVITQQFNVQQSPQELAAQQARTFQILVTASIVIIVSSVLAILIHRRRNQESHH